MSDFPKHRALVMHVPPSGSRACLSTASWHPEPSGPVTKLCQARAWLGSQSTRIRYADFLPDEIMCCNINVSPPSQLHRDRRGPQKFFMWLLVTERKVCWQSHFCFHMYRNSTFSTSPFHSTLSQSASFSSPLYFI